MSNFTIAEDQCGLPEIQLNNRRMRDVTTESLTALRTSNDPTVLFVRWGTAMVYREPVRLWPTVVSVNRLRSLLERAADYLERDRPVPPPIGVVRDILSRPAAEWGLPAFPEEGDGR
jgi:hypothetical protein